jgi:hypothetical protein
MGYAQWGAVYLNSCVCPSLQAQVQDLQDMENFDKVITADLKGKKKCRRKKRDRWLFRL